MLRAIREDAPPPTNSGPAEPHLCRPPCHAKEKGPMRSRTQGSSEPSRRIPENACAAEFLESFGERDEPVTAAEAEYAGPWWTRRLEDRPGVAVLRRWEGVEQGDVPEAGFLHFQRALLMPALLPALEREPLFHLSEERGPE